MTRATAASGPGLVVALEGFDGAGTAEAAERVGRWLERKGWSVRFHASEPSALVRAAAGNPRTRRALTPRVAALLAASDTTRRSREIASTLGPGSALVIDRYAWTGAARDAARGVDLAWTAALYRACPIPTVVVLVEQPPALASDMALAARETGAPLTPASGAFAAFMQRVALGYDRLARAAATIDPEVDAPDPAAVASDAADSTPPRPWPTKALRVPAAAGPDGVLVAVRTGLGRIATSPRSTR